MGFLKPKAATSTSENKNMAKINEAYSPSIATGNNATNFIGQLLGVSDGGNAFDAFSKYKDLAGYAPALRDMQRGVVGGQASKGLLNSGSTSTKLLQKGQELDSSTFGNFLQQLAGLSGLGLQGGGLVTNAGQTSSSQGGGPSTASTIASAVGTIASIFSDRRTKRDITHIQDFDDGLGLYTFRYLDDEELRLGVMADEVEKIRPWALGPVVGGFKTVNYARL